MYIFCYVSISLSTYYKYLLNKNMLILYQYSLTQQNGPILWTNYRTNTPKMHGLGYKIPPDPTARRCDPPPSRTASTALAGPLVVP